MGGGAAPQVAVDPEGNAIAVWYQYDGALDHVWSNRYEAGSGAWGTAGKIETDNTYNAQYPQVVLDVEGNAIAVWHQWDGTRWNVWANRFD